MDMRQLGTTLLLAAAPALCVACEDSGAKDCIEFFDVAAPIMSSVTVPTIAPSGSAAVAWARDGAKQYERLAQEAKTISERATEINVKAWQDEKYAAAEVAKQLNALADAATSVDASNVLKINSALESAARAERDAAGVIEQRCAR